MRVSTDGENYVPLRPEGVTANKFPCARHYGSESGVFKLPKPVVGDNVVVQLQFEHEYGTTTQCADIIVQKLKPFVATKCDPPCKNGGVCQNGLCKCSKMYYGDHCENKVEASGMFSIFLFIALIALLVVGVLLLRQRDRLQD